MRAPRVQLVQRGPRRRDQPRFRRPVAEPSLSQVEKEAVLRAAAAVADEEVDPSVEVGVEKDRGGQRRLQARLASGEGLGTEDEIPTTVVEDELRGVLG